MIKSPLLPQTKGYVAGRWMDAQSGGTLAVIDPATGEHLADVPAMGEAETRAALEVGQTAINADKSSTADRQAWLTLIGERLLRNRNELARIITLEHGKPHKEAIGEVEYSAGFFNFFAKVLRRIDPETLSEHPRNCRWTINHRPAGIAALITPWNFPLAMLSKKLAPALVAGCSIVTKPASKTPLSAIALYAIIDSVGVPHGKVNLVIGSPGPIGKIMCTHPAVRIISFTGSTEVGKSLAAQAAPQLKRLALELGGNAPFIVFPDVDLSTTADGLIANKFRAGGQTCVCANRVYVHEDIADDFAAVVAERTAKLKVGNGLDPDTDVGPLINRDGFDKVAAHVADAIARGAKRLIGDDPPRPAQDWGAFYPPTVLIDVNADCLICREETFGPVIAIARFSTEDEVVALANGTPYGLAAYLFTRDSQRANRLIQQLQFGHVGLNTGTGPTPEAPFGGMKESGYGREGGIEGLLEFCETQVVASE